MTKRCWRCGNRKPLSEFCKTKSNADGHATQCRECQRDYFRQYRIAKRDLLLEYQRNYRAEYRKPGATIKASKRKHSAALLAAAGFKRCCKCKTVKPVGEFYNQASKADGLAAACKACQCVAQHARLKAKRPPKPPKGMKRCKRCGEVKLLAAFPKKGCCITCRREAIELKKRLPKTTPTHKRCCACKTTKPARAFSRDATSTDGLHHRCKACVRAAQVNWERTYPEKTRASNQRRRASKNAAAGAGYTTSRHIHWRWEFWGNRCWICGQLAEATDHVKPLAVGGSHYPANMRPICRSCNSKKGVAYELLEIRDSTIIGVRRLVAKPR